MRRAFQLKNAPEAGIPIIIASLSESTRKQYNTTYKKWWEFCNITGTKIFQPTVKEVLEFLQKEFENGASYTTENTHRSALALLFSLPEEDEKLIKRFLKGVFKSRPTFPKYSHTWDPSTVLFHLEKQYASPLSLIDLTLKLTTLLALTSAQRVQTLAKIKVNDIKVHGREKIEILVSSIVKTSAPNRDQPFIVFPFFDAKPELCVASTLIQYLEITKPLRTDKVNQELLLTYKKPIHPASTQTISRWIKTVLKKSGIDTDIFKSHSTRHASTSAAARTGVNINTIRKAAGWTEKSRVFNKFYNRTVTEAPNFAANILLSLPD